MFLFSHVTFYILKKSYIHILLLNSSTNVGLKSHAPVTEPARRFPFLHVLMQLVENLKLYMWRTLYFYRTALLGPFKKYKACEHTDN